MSGHCENPERNCLNCDLKSPLFCFLTDEELVLVRDNKITVVYKKGETIRKQGTYMSHVLSINSGFAKLYLEGLDNHNAIIRIIKPTNFVGGPGIYLDRLHHYTLSALTDCSVCFIDVDLFKKLIDENKTFANELMKDFSKSILSVYNRLIFLTQKQMPGRMADTLIYLFEEIFQTPRFSMYLSKQDLADLSGMAKDSAIKILRDFQNAGLIRITDSDLMIIDPEALKRISRTG
ncbi:MAG: Crp/Fnr family transcriptional regulator [Bacteroidales bacterium]|nr:Crp/Fnr family transcriptional regulator [Bacteroidales bacterium]